MKKSLQLTLILSALLFTFSCSEGEVLDTSDPGDVLGATWQVASISAYDDVSCSETAIFDYTGSGGAINAPTAADCQNLEWFATATADNGAASFTTDDFCAGVDNLNVSVYLQMSSDFDSLATEAAGNYTHTMYATVENGKDHTEEYSTYGRYFTYGTNMITQILAKVDSDTGQASRVVAANEGPEDEVSWTYNTSMGLTMTWVDPASAGDADATTSCVVITYEPATDYDLRGCTDETAVNYFGGDNNDFELTATEETGNCSYTEDEASQACVKISHDDLNGDGLYEDDEVLTYDGIIDCAGGCQYAAAAEWVGDGNCDNGNRDHGTYNCEAFNWDGWDCACNIGCVATYIDEVIGSVDLLGEETAQIGEGTCQDDDADTADVVEGCNVEECGYDISNLALTSTWDCCSTTCLASLTAAPGTCPADEACNTGACNFFRPAGAGGIGVCCDPGDDADGVPINCATLANDGNCDEACNTGECNYDGGVDCE